MATCWSSKNELNPLQVRKNSNKKYLFDCMACEHEIEMALNNVTAGQWCKYCNGNHICLDDNCNVCFDKSFASHHLAESWSVINTIMPRQVMKGSDLNAYFDCRTCNHTFQSRLFSIKAGAGCPYCVNQKLCSNTDCNLCLNKSCASHEMGKAWSSDNLVISRNVFLQSNKQVIFNCIRCNHKYSNTPNHYYTRGGSCPYCDNKKICDKDECIKCYNSSFASHVRANCWSKKNTISPRNIFKGSNTRIMFNCDKCNCEFNSMLFNVLTGYWCPYCKNKTEGVILDFLKENYTNYKSQLRFEWCRYSKTNNIMPFDFGFEDHKILIELDGIQHFKQVAQWDSPEVVQLKDNEKITKAIDKGYSIIHIYQDEVWNNKYDWKTIMKETIDMLIAENTPQVCFISKCDIYQSHISSLNESINYCYLQPEV